MSSENLTSGTTAPPDLPPPNYVNALVEWAATYAGEIKACCTSTGTHAPPEPSQPRYANALVDWVTSCFGEIDDCCTSKGLPKPPHW